MRVLILGMGNPILSDDGVGLLIAKEVGRRIEGVEVVTTTSVGLNLLDLVVGYDKIFLIDALTTGEKIIGELVKLKGGKTTSHLFSSHGINFFELLQIGKEFGYRMPEVGEIYGIEIGGEVSFGEELSLELREKIPYIIESIVDDITSTF
ncbi:MAG: Hydrogenase maturation protease [Candidatus Methanolliviera sp. GoM_oil]|nr:MAG: Hydrogenase maturation protease [Candidatus Methanolliviera sp. GoM_oil]